MNAFIMGTRPRFALSAMFAALCLSACGGGGSDGNVDGGPPPVESPPPPTYTIGGTVSGLRGSGLVLQLDSANDLPVTADGNFQFTQRAAAGASYSVTTRAQPVNPAQNCVVSAGSGTATANVTTVQVNCSTLPLALIAAEPANDSREVSRLAAPRLEFSAALNPTQAMADALQLNEVGRDAVPGAWSIVGANATFVPSAPLWPLTQYELVADGVAGLHGENLTAAVRTRFTTRDGQWSVTEPTMRAVDDVTLESMQLAMNAAGVGAAVWLGREIGEVDNQVLASTRAADGTWSAPVAVGTHRDIENLDVAVEADGRVHLVWAGIDSGGQARVYTSRVEPGSALWSPPEQLSDEADLTNIEVGVAAGSAGVFAVWKAGDGIPYSIRMARWHAGSWSPSIVVSEGADNALLPQVVADQAGHALFVWSEQVGGLYLLKSRLYHDTGSSAGWVQEEIPVSAQAAGYPGIMPFRLALNADGLGALIWSADAGGAGGAGVWAALYTIDVFEAGQGTGWGTAINLEGSQAANGLFADVAVDGNGDVVAVWMGEYAGSEYQVLSRRLSRQNIARTAPLTTAWGSLELLGAGVVPRVALDARGNGALTWYPLTGEEGIQWRRLTRRDGWNDPQMLRVKPDSVFPGNYELAFDGRGSATAVWLEGVFTAGPQPQVGMASATFE